MEIAGFVIGILGLIIAYLTYRNTYIKEPKEDLEYINNQFLFAERSTSELITELDDYASENQCYHIELMQGLSFQEGITFLKNAHVTLFTEENKIALLNMSQGKKEVKNIERRIEIHIKGIQEIRTQLNFYFKKDFTAGLSI